MNFAIDLRQPQPTVEVQFCAINYLRRDLVLTEVKITQLSLGGPFVVQVPLVQEYPLRARRSLNVCCRRHLMDSEICALAAERRREHWLGSYALVARARAGSRLYTYGPVVAMAIEGWVHRPA